mgnify:FL=1
MKKILIGVLLTGIMFLSSCNGYNKELFDTIYKYDTAILSLPDGRVINGMVESWTDYDDGDQIQVKINGDTYLVHASNIVLIAKKNN